MTALYRITMSILIVLIIISIVTCALSVVAAQTPRTLVNDANVKITKSGHRIIIDANNSQYVLVAHRVKKTEQQTARTLIQTADITVCTLPHGGLRVISGNSVYIILTHKGAVSNG